MTDNVRARYESLIANMSDETLINSLLLLGANDSREYEIVTVRADLCAQAEARFPETERLMSAWVSAPDRVGTYAHALVAAVIAVRETKR